MSDNIVNFPAKETIDANHILENAKDQLEDCVVIGVTKDGNLYTGICAENSQQVIYLLRTLEHLIMAEDLG